MLRKGHKNALKQSSSSFISAYCDEILNDLFDKTIKNTLVPKLTDKAKKDITNFIIEWVRSLDPVR